MLAKTCPECGRRSYSAMTSGKWTCPYCGADLTEQPAGPAVERPEAGRTAAAWSGVQARGHDVH